MSSDVSAQITAIATRGGACHLRHRNGHRGNPRLLEAIKEVRDMAEMLKVQSERLADQRGINEEHAKVLELQAGELRESLAERQRETEQRHRAQASCVFITQERHPTAPRGYPNRKASARW